MRPVALFPVLEARVTPCLLVHLYVIYIYGTECAYECEGINTNAATSTDTEMLVLWYGVRTRLGFWTW